MCGIVGVNGCTAAVPFLLEGLRRLEYRGYDSAGIALLEAGEIQTVKCRGRVGDLAKKVERQENLSAVIGIGHTRWATRGEANDANAHPHTCGEFSIVHNGILENEKELKEKYLRLCPFSSDTDSEVIAQLLHRLYDGNVLETVAKVADLLKGSFAFAVLCADAPDALFCVRRSSPLLVGVGEAESFVASDLSAMTESVQTLYRMEDDEIAEVKRDSAAFFDFSLQPIEKAAEPFDQRQTAVNRGSFEHFMLKEIHEVPTAIRRTVQEGKLMPEADFAKPSRIFFSACGSAYHVGEAAAFVWEDWLQIPVEVSVASEFRTRKLPLPSGSWMVIVSQSGETADSLAALREAKKQGIPVLSIVNVPNSAIAVESDYVFYTKAGTEVAVATTKAYEAQLAAVYALGLSLAEKWETLDRNCIEKYKRELNRLATAAEEALKTEEQMRAVAERMPRDEPIFFIGRGQGYAASMEAALKLKEVSYLPAQSYPAGEMKHGTISLIRRHSPVFAFCLNEELNAKMQCSMDELTARGAKVTAVSFSEDLQASERILLPKVAESFAVSMAVIPMQLLAYYTARRLGC
ncbi:MAG TPA: glutamine--fructose-6-phosphate transaminase (isomerizing), partial [Ruminococcaceae bacterium]|nr:glutamine--fructose-6-phosphate transaminase (isomerizing) [Oscillospiraceae bacterium]